MLAESKPKLSAEEIVVGSTYGTRTVIAEAEWIRKSPQSRRYCFYLCRCEACGREKRVRANSLRSGQGCGCQYRLHNMCSEPIYKLWTMVKTRCRKPGDRRDSYNRSEEEDITFCKKWADDFRVFYEWAKQSGYEPGKCLLRHDLDAGFSLENCYWSDLKEAQSRVRGKLGTRITAWGETKYAKDWIKDPRCPIQTANTLTHRILHSKLSAEQIISGKKVRRYECQIGDVKGGWRVIGMTTEYRGKGLATLHSVNLECIHCARNHTITERHFHNGAADCLCVSGKSAAFSPGGG